MQQLGRSLSLRSSVSVSAPLSVPGDHNAIYSDDVSDSNQSSICCWHPFCSQAHLLSHLFSIHSSAAVPVLCRTAFLPCISVTSSACKPAFTLRWNAPLRPNRDCRPGIAIHQILWSTDTLTRSSTRSGEGQSRSLPSRRTGRETRDLCERRNSSLSPECPAGQRSACSALPLISVLSAFLSSV